MNTKWFIIGISLGVFVNLLVLYALTIDIKRRVETLSENQTMIVSQSADDESSEPARPSSPSLPLDDFTVSTDSADCPDCAEKLSALENEYEKLLERIKVIEDTSLQPAAAQPVSQPGVKEIMVSFGSGLTREKDWKDIPGMNAYINSTNYPSISSVRFEVALRISTAQGWVHARLFNKTDGHPVWFSEVLSEGDISVIKQSEPVTLDSGNKLYQVQMKTTIGAEAYADSARVKIILK